MMEGRLYFCADQILRFKSDFDDATALPLLSIQQTLPAEDPWFLLRFLRHPVIIEQGTTLAAILIATEAWQEVLTALLDRDVAAYIREVKKPAPPASTGLDWVSVRRYTAVVRGYQSLAPGEDEDADLSDYFSRELTPADDFDIETECAAFGVTYADPQHWSLSENIHEIKNLPVIADTRQYLEFLPQDALLNTDVAGVEYSTYRHRLNGETWFSFRELMEAIFISGLFYYSPAAAENSVRELQRYLAESEENTEDQDDTADAPQQDEPLPATAFSIEFAEDAFDSLAEHNRQQTEEWQALKNRCRQYAGLPVRIGNILPACPPEP